ncbi:hypothetical protein DB31_3236 [Hyalangium minutum]|uniref:Uncharacterized protein n=1 Tax=Hyalangium minutum TaxID=394096 RepID=A0A085WTU3_9BACT|nr:hypothetical protein DB31_3236 [Hyalangium minutum]
MSVLFVSWLLVSWAGGSDELSRITGAAGSFSSLVLLSGLVELVFLTLMVCHIGIGRVVPLAVMLGMATLPWTVGLLGTEVIVGRVVAALAGLEIPDARNALALGVGEAMAARMLGAWMSAALLLGLGLGLAMAGASAELPFRSSPQGSTPSLVLGVVVALTLATIALLGALEAHRLFELLTGLPQTPIADRTRLLSQAADDVMRLRPLRQACLALLIILAVVLLVWQTRRYSRMARGWMGSVFLAAAVTALLFLDAHPLRLAEQGARAAGVGAPSLPRGFEPLRTSEAAMPHPFAALVTAEGLTPVGSARLGWSSPGKALAESLMGSLHSTLPQSTRPSGVVPEPVLPVLADARTPGASLRRLVEASALAGARSVELVGQHPQSANLATLAKLKTQVPLLSLLAAQEGTLQLLLPAALSKPVTLSWQARFGEGEQLLLSPVQGGETLSLSLSASLAEVPHVLAGTFVGLELPEDISLKELGAAAEVLGLAGASPVVVLDPASRTAQPMNGGTSTLWLPRSPGPLAPKRFQRTANEARLPEQAPARPPEPVTATQRSQPSSAMATMRPTANTSTIAMPSNLPPAGAWGAAPASGSLF